ncbi:MAG TPA: YncE family protein [Acidobacteriaceae bacterium]|jgi:DNA-binding beta-propeller fold protein YncE|nr:YncE family protein [Acidobacteriaceae bacterium]
MRSWRARLLSGSVLAVSLLALGCGNQYRPVVSAINPVGPAGQPAKYAIAISNPGPTLPGLLTFVDFAGDTVLTTPQILSNPSYLALSPVTGEATTGFVINSAGSFNEFPDGSPASLISSDIVQSTLSAGATPVSITSLTLAGTTPTIFVPEPGLSQIAALSTSGGSLEQNISILNNPVYVVGTDNALRAYAIGQGNGTDNGTVSSIESVNLAVASTIPVGVDPVYGVMTADGRRAFILNKGSGTVNVINVINNGLDNNSTLGPNSTIAVGLNPVWADLAPTNAELVVLNAGDGVHAGSLSIISIPLCSAAAQPTNPNCDAANPVDATGFGTVLKTVPVGVNPKMVSVLQDGTKAYVANAGVDCTGIPSGCTTVEGSVSVVDLTSGTVTATIPAVSSAPATAGADTTPGSVYGHPATIVATTGSPTGKVYVTSPDNKYLTIIETDTNTVVSHVNLQGLGVRVVITQQ